MEPRTRFWLGVLIGNALGAVYGDVMITKAEIDGLKANLLYVDTPPGVPTRLTDWLREHRETVGKRYAGELLGERTTPKHVDGAVNLSVDYLLPSRFSASRIFFTAIAFTGNRSIVVLQDL